MQAEYARLLALQSSQSRIIKKYIYEKKIQKKRSDLWLIEVETEGREIGGWWSKCKYFQILDKWVTGI